ELLLAVVADAVAVVLRHEAQVVAVVVAVGVGPALVAVAAVAVVVDVVVDLGLRDDEAGVALGVAVVAIVRQGGLAVRRRAGPAVVLLDDGDAVPVHVGVGPALVEVAAVAVVVDV